MPLRAELLAALRAPAPENITAICCSHTLTETVHFAALSLLRLIGTYHPNTPLLFFIKGRFPVSVFGSLKNDNLVNYMN